MSYCKYEDIFAQLAQPFEPAEVKVRTQAGRQLHYVTARTVMNRLDNVVGGSNWWDSYEAREASVVCSLTVRLPDGSTITKCDAGGHAGMADEGDDEKSAFSDAFKRAAVKFGVGRYLYRDSVPHAAQALAAQVGGSVAPPAEAGYDRGPERAPARQPARENDQPRGGGNGQGGGYGTPRTGKALFAWVREQEQRHDVGLLKYLNSWAKLQDLPGRMVDWDADQVARAHAEATRKLAAVGQQPAESGPDY